MTKEHVFGMADILATARKRFTGNNSEIIGLLPDFIEILSAHICNSLVEVNKNGGNEWVFVNFWKLSWKNEAGRPDFLDMRSIFNSSSSSRKLTQRFVESGEIVDDELEQYFQYILSRGTQHVDLLQSLALTAQKSGNLYPKELKLGKNIAYLFRAFFTSVLILTFEKDGQLTVPGIGTFERHFKIKKKKNSEDTKGGVLHFHPDTSI